MVLTIEPDCIFLLIIHRLMKNGRYRDSIEDGCANSWLMALMY